MAVFVGMSALYVCFGISHFKLKIIVKPLFFALKNLLFCILEK